MHICRLVAAQVGERSYMEILENSCGKEEVEKARIPLDSYVENWPQNLVGRDQMVGPLLLTPSDKRIQSPLLNKLPAFTIVWV